MTDVIKNIEQNLEESLKGGTISFDCSKDVNKMLDDWIETSKILGDKYKVKEYKNMKNILTNNKRGDTMNETLRHLKNQLADKQIELDRANSEVSFWTKRQCEAFKEVCDLQYRIKKEMEKNEND